MSEPLPVEAMSAPTEPGTPFADDVVAAVADEHDLDAAALASLADRHQRSVRSLPGVDELVYEWRKNFDGAVLDRTEVTYYLSVPEWVWGEFGESLDLSADATDALAAVHRRTVEGRDDLPDEPGPDRTFVVLDRRDRTDE